MVARPFVFLAAFATLIAGAAPLSAQYELSRQHAPEPDREFRAAWIATVWNIDWPSKPGLTPSQQRTELLRILDLAAGLRLNAVLFQVRPESDALYASKLEPWSAWLSGTQGQAPSDGYDPLAFAVTEAHRRGLELHAWFNPFRARANAKTSPASNHLTRTKPDWLMSAGSQTWLNPALPEVQKWSIDVICDVVRRYDIDGVHLDDYFYPYPQHVESGVRLLFDDSATYAAYRKSGGREEVEVWRRERIDTFVRDLDRAVKRTKPWVTFGISPFGIWQPDYPSGIEAGINAPEHLFADSRKWIHEGWVDYLSPQLYWRIDQTPQSFTRLAEWWGEQNRKDRHVWPGIASSRIQSTGSDRARTAAESLKQIEATRQLTATSRGAGHIHWSMSALMEDRGGLRGELLREGYRDVAVVPESPWQGEFGKLAKPEDTVLEATGEGMRLQWKRDPNVRWRVIQVRDTPDGAWRSARLVREDAAMAGLAGSPSALTLRTVVPSGRLSEPVSWVR